MPTCRSRTDVDDVEQINARAMLDAATSAAATMTVADGQPRTERRRRLSAAALSVASQKVRKAYSPIVIAGVVRIVDFLLIGSVGISLYLAYVAPRSGISWEYVAAILGMTVAAVLSFQAADIYEVEVFRGQLRQMTRMISAFFQAEDGIRDKAT